MKTTLTLTILLLIIAAPLTAQHGDWYNDEGGYTFHGAGTKNDPYQISSTTSLAYLAEQVNMRPGKSFREEYFILTDDIDLGEHFWIPIGVETHQPFRGVVDGNGKTIRNLYIGSSERDSAYATAGLFGCLGNGAMIENLTIDGGEVRGGRRDATAQTGSLAGYLLCNVSEGRDSIVIRNCHSRRIKITGAKTEAASTGGLIGEGYSFADGNGEAFILIENCSSGNNVAASESDFPYVGGIIGKGRGHGYCDGAYIATGRLIIRSCRNDGKVAGGNVIAEEAITSTGGILGFGYSSGNGYGGSNGSAAFTIEYCLNTGNVTGGDADGRQAFSYTGGIAGYADGYGYTDLSRSSSSANGSGHGAFVVQTSINRGTIRGGDASDDAAVSSTGGIIGFASGSASDDGGKGGQAYGSFNMRSCYSYASITTKNGFIGGLAGSLTTIGKGINHTISASILNSYVAGMIDREDTPYPVVTGGVVGQMIKTEDALNPPYAARCLVVLSYLKGDAGRTFRIVGKIEGVAQPYTRMLSRNYAYITGGDWNKDNIIRNGYNWSRSVYSPPISMWTNNFEDETWTVEDDSFRLMPLLSGVPGQEAVPIPPR
jgi:hypothetical protein